jgi:hypothetical protein
MYCRPISEGLSYGNDFGESRQILITVRGCYASKFDYLLLGLSLGGNEYKNSCSDFTISKCIFSSKVGHLDYYLETQSRVDFR